MWMNECDIEYCRPETEILQGAAAFLRDFMKLINTISDGWVYWGYGTKCSTDLQELVQTPPCGQPGVSAQQVEAAQKKILRFLSRCKQTKDDPDVRGFMATHQGMCRVREVDFVPECHILHGLGVRKILERVEAEAAGRNDTEETRYWIRDRMQYALNLNGITGLVPEVRVEMGNLYLDFVPVAGQGG